VSNHVSRLLCFENSCNTESISLYSVANLVFLSLSLSLSLSHSLFFRNSVTTVFPVGASLFRRSFERTGCYEAADAVDERRERGVLMALHGIFDRTINGTKPRSVLLVKEIAAAKSLPRDIPLSPHYLRDRAREIPPLRYRDKLTRYFNCCKSAPRPSAAIGNSPSFGRGVALNLIRRLGRWTNRTIQ